MQHCRSTALPLRRAAAHPASSLPRLALAPLALAVVAAWSPAGQAAGLAGELGLGQGDFGGVGLMQTPTARMAPEGTMSINFNRTSPYRRYSFILQPLSWLEGGFRYVEVEDRLFGETIAGDRRYLDKGFDMKLRLLEETRYWPQLALGFRDVGGTTLFGSEYLVASKRWYDLDFHLGLGWGYLGNAADVETPLGWLSDRFDDRPRRAGGDRGGEFALDALFRGPMALFGGIEYQTPWDPLVLQLEYEGNDYSNEPAAENPTQASRFNVGARLALTDNLDLRAGWQRGEVAMAGLSFHFDLAGMSQVKRDPSPAELDAAPREDWSAVAGELERNAGMRVAEIQRDGNSLRVVAEPTTFRSLAQSEGRAGRILHAQADATVERLRYRWESRGLSLRESVHDRENLVAAVRTEEAALRHKHGIYVHARLDQDGETLYQADAQRFDWRLSPRLDQNLGGPDGYLYRLVGVADAEYQTDRNGWFSGSLAATLVDNLDKYEYRGPSELPRVRTFIGDYLNEASVGIEHLQYTRTSALGDDWYAMGYGGLLEMMFAGAGGELLYRPFNSRLALGADLNWVRQRDFEQRFDLRDYDTWTGHLTAYVETGLEGILARASVGRYLAGDVGGTLDLSREFASGARVGAWATWTDADDDFGEGGFDKGLYVSIPFDAFFTHSSRQYATLAWRPLTRDGGAKLSRRYGLYHITDERDLGHYWRDHPTTWQ